jgi:hypothetical protein
MCLIGNINAGVYVAKVSKCKAADDYVVSRIISWLYTDFDLSEQ